MDRRNLVVSITGGVGGAGASVFSLALADRIRAVALDGSAHSGGISWAAICDPRRLIEPWPVLIGERAENSVADLVFKVGPGRVYSGGFAPPQQGLSRLARMISEHFPVVVESPHPLPDADLCVVVATNHIRGWEEMLQIPTHYRVIRRVPEGVVPSQFEIDLKERPYSVYRHSARDLESIEFGMGVQPSNRVHNAVNDLIEWMAVLYESKSRDS